MPSLPHQDDSLDVVIDAVRARPRSIDVSEVVSLLATTDPADRATVTKLLGTLVEQNPTHASEAVQHLVPLLNLPDADLRSEVIIAIGYIATDSPQSLAPAIGSLIDHLDDDMPLVRYNAAAALAEAAATYPTSIAAAIPQLRALLDSDRPLLQVYVTSILHDLATDVPEAVSSIVPVLIDTIEAQFETMDDDIPVDDDTDEQLTAVHGGTPQFETESREVRTTIRLNVAATLVRIADHDLDAVAAEITRILEVVRRETDPEVLLSLLTLLGVVAEHHPNRVLPVIDHLGKRLQETNDSTVIGKITWVCSLLADAAPETVSDVVQPALPAIIDALEAEPQVQIPAISLLAYVAEQYPEQIKSARPVLGDLLDSDHPSAQIGAALTLGFVGDNATLSTLRSVHDDAPHQDVRRAAEKSIQLIQQRRGD